MNYRLLVDMSQQRERIEILHDVLLHRGFLVEYDEEGRLCLSDNCAMGNGRCPFLWDDKWISDIKYLNKLLQKTGLGSVGKSRIIHYNGAAITDRVLSAFFAYNRIPRIVYFQSADRNPELFFGCEDGNLRAKKIQLVMLEPYVGLLVKAYSAIGARSVTSCDGHGSYNVSVGFISFPNTCWAFANTEIALKALNIDRIWSIDGDYVESRAIHSFSTFYRDVIRVARFIYENRLKILEAKAMVLKEADPKMYLDEAISYDYTMDIMETALRRVIAI